MFRYKCRQVWIICWYNFRLWSKNPRIVMTFCLALVTAFLLSGRANEFGEKYGTWMQAFEPFIWTFGDGVSIMLASTLLLLLFADIPVIHAGTPVFLIRTSKKCWIAGQILYIILATLLYTGAVFVFTTILCIKNTFPGNVWSETAAILGYSGAGDKLGLPSAVRVMERTSPYECAAQIFLLLLCYCLSMVMIMLCINLKWSAKAGLSAGIMYGLTGLLLNPELLEELLGEQVPVWRIKVFLGWVSPLNHATYKMHSFGYDRLPTIGQTYLCLTGLTVAATVWAVQLMKNYNFQFTGRQ